MHVALYKYKNLFLLKNMFISVLLIKVQSRHTPAEVLKLLGGPCLKSPGLTKGIGRKQGPEFFII